jgi:hypothetical protein
MSKPLTDFQRVLLLIVWLIAFGVVILLGFDTRARATGGELTEIWRLFLPLITAGLITLMVHLSNRISKS